MSKHTPVPWTTNNEYIYGRSVGGCRMVEDSFPVAHIRGWGHLQYVGNERAAEIQRANAEYIVRAVNCHDELVAALESVIPPEGDDEQDGWWCPECKRWLTGHEVTYTEHCVHCNTFLTQYQCADSVISKARAVLAKAKELE